MPIEPAAIITVPTRDTVINDATRVVESVFQRATIMIQKITSAPMSANADRRCRARIQSFRLMCDPGGY